MSRMKDLFGDTPYTAKEAYQLVRRSDPDTSWRSAAAVAPRAGTIKEQVLQVHLEAKPVGLTDPELHQICIKRFGHRPESSYRKRRSDLVTDKLVIDSGRRVEHEGSTRIVWVAV